MLKSSKADDKSVLGSCRGPYFINQCSYVLLLCDGRVAVYHAQKERNIVGSKLAELRAPNVCSSY